LATVAVIIWRATWLRAEAVLAASTSFSVGGSVGTVTR
jgi:hypothetical protein